jgi:hypothetical protein
LMSFVWSKLWAILVCIPQVLEKNMYPLAGAWCSYNVVSWSCWVLYPCWFFYLDVLSIVESKVLTSSTVIVGLLLSSASSIRFSLYILLFYCLMHAHLAAIWWLDTFIHIIPLLGICKLLT